MKKLNYFLILSLLLFLNCACSDNDDVILHDPKIPLAGEIKFVFEANQNDRTAGLFILGKNVTIDWGDGGVETLNNEEVVYFKHTYLVQSQEYVITVKGEEIIQIGNIRASNPDYPLEHKFKELSIGDKVYIRGLNIDTDFIETINVGSQVKVNKLTIAYFMDEFDFSQFTGLDITDMDIYIAGNNKNLNINGLKTQSIVLNYKSYINTGSINISSCKELRYLKLYSKLMNGKEVMTTVKDFTIEDTPSLLGLSLYYTRFNSVDISRSKASVNIRMECCGVKNNLIFNEEMKELVILEDYETGDNYLKEDYTKEIDVSNCEKLEELVLERMNGLEKINVGSIGSLKIVGINHCYKLKNINFNNLPELNFLGFRSKDKSDILESAEITNNPKLATIECENSNLKSINSTNNANLSNLILSNNELDETQLLKLIGSLSDTPGKDESLKKKLQLNNNPGLTNNVRQAVEKLTYWEIN